jgi:hypothetical protein
MNILAPKIGDFEIDEVNRATIFSKTSLRILITFKLLVEMISLNKTV